MVDSRQTKPVEIAAFDFDGTCISGNSPVILVSHLVRKGLLGKDASAHSLLGCCL